MFAKLKNNLSLVFSKSWSFLRPRQKLGLVSFVLLSSIIISASFIFTPAAHAGVGDWILETFADIFLALAGFFIKLTFFVLKFIIEVAGYNGFIDSSAVIVGWVMVRDVTNMFFVVVLLIISFGTILGLERYEYKKLLVKLIMAAVIVNFSRIICGLIIDIAQVVMITFVNGIAATASGNLVNMFQVDQIFKLAEGQAAKPVGAPQLFLAGVAALTFSVIMLVTMLTFLFLLMARMAMLWVLIVLSPFAFVLNVLPQTEKYASQWWGEFGGHVVAGPIIAFFLWLSFVTVGSGAAHDEIVNNNALNREQTTQAGSPEEQQTGLTEIMSWEKMANFAIAIAMLLAGAKMAQQLGVVGGSMMGKAGELGKKVAMYASGVNAARWGAGMAWKGAKGAGKLAGKGIYHGTNLIPLVHGVHPEQWKRRYSNVKDKFWTWRQEKLNRGTSEATKISKMFRTNEKGEYVKEGPKVAGNERLDAQGNIMRDEKGNILYKDQVQSGPGDWFTRQATRFLLETTPKYRGFQAEMSADVQETRKATEEQLAHLASGSQLPVGRAKLEAKQKLKELEETGGGIKAGKEARWVERRDEILDIIEEGNKNKTDYKTQLIKAHLKDEFGMSEEDIADAENAVKRRKRSVEGKIQAEKTKELTSADQANREAKGLDLYMKKGVGFGTGKEQGEKAAILKSETKQIEDRLASEKQIEELEAIRRLLESKKGGDLGKAAVDKMALLENVKFEMGELNEQKIAKARDEYLRNPGPGKESRESEAVNFENVIAKQTKARIERMSVGDYTYAIERIRAQQKKVKELEAETDPISQAAARVARKNLSEMQMASEGKGGVFAEGSLGAILDGMGGAMPKDHSMALEKDSIRNMQAQWLATKLGRAVKAEKDELQKAMQEFRELQDNDDIADAVLEQARVALENAAGQGSIRLAGLLRTKINAQTGKKETNFTDVDDKDPNEGLGYVAGRRTNALSGAKITSLGGGLQGLVDKRKGASVVDSADAINTLSKVLAPLTSNVLSNVDTYVKESLAEIFGNSEVGKLNDLRAMLKENKNSDVVSGLLKEVLNGIKSKKEESRTDTDKQAIAELTKAVQELAKAEKKEEKK